jgi:hypothetical protein
VLFDLLAKDDRDYRSEAFSNRRKKLESLFSNPRPPLYLTPATDDSALAQDWFRRFEGAGFDGVMAKSKNGLYEFDKRTMYKITHERECDCVVAGFRWYRKGEQQAVGSLLLALYDDVGVLQHVGVCGSFPLKVRYELVNYLKPYRKNAKAHHPWERPVDSGSPRRPVQKTGWPRADGARGKISFGSRYGLNLSPRLDMTPCKADDYARWSSSADGASISDRKIAGAISLRWLRLGN